MALQTKSTVLYVYIEEFKAVIITNTTTGIVNQNLNEYANKTHT